MAQNRRHLTSHPWISFRADFSKAGVCLWIQLGAAESKIRHVANTLLPPAVSQELHEVYLAKGVRATTAIEGNTLSEDEVRKIIKGEQSVPKSRAYQATEVENIIAGCNGILAETLTDHGDTRLSVDLLRKFNKLILNGLPLNEGVVPGEIPTHNVVVAGYRGAPRGECEFLLERMCQWINDEIAPPSKELTVVYAIIRSVLAHLYLAWIHPFGDGNGRTARLVELQILLAAGVPSVCAHLMSNHYNLTRNEYYRQLDRTSKSGGDVVPFIEYAVNGLVDGLVEQIQKIDEFQWGATWKEFVYGTFKNRTTKTQLRQRQLALDLWRVGTTGCLRSEVRKLTPDLAESYAMKNQRTIDRDIDALCKMNMVEVDENTVRVQFRPLKQLLPPRRPVDWLSNQPS